MWVGIALLVQRLRYELDGLGIESRWRRDFQHPSRPDRPGGQPSLLYNGYRIIPGDKAARAWHAHPPHLAPRLKKEYSPSGPSWPVLG